MDLQCIFTGWKTLLCLWLFRIRSWNARFWGFLNARLQNDGRLLTPYKCACSTFIFKHRAFPSSVTTPSTGTITPYSILHPNTPRALIGWNLSHHKTHPPYMGIPTHWRRGGGGALKHARHSHSHTYKPMQMLWGYYSATLSDTSAYKSQHSCTDISL